MNLIKAASRAGARLVPISVVGSERIPVISGVERAMLGYVRSKLAAERVVTEFGLPSFPVVAMGGSCAWAR